MFVSWRKGPIALFAGVSCALLAGDLHAEEGEEVMIVIPDEEVGSGEADGDEQQAQGDEDGGETSEDEVDDVRLEDVVVEAERLTTVGGAAQALNEQELERLESDDPHDVLLAVPGVYVRMEDGFGLRPNIGMRGANPERSKKVALMQDGVLFGPAPYAAPAAYYFPLVNRMVEVQVFKGPSAIQYGPNTIGGAINWKSREVPEAKVTGGVDVNLGSYLTGKAHGFVGAGNEWGGVLVEGLHWQSDGFKELDGGGDTGFDRQEVMLKARLNTDRDADVVHSLHLKAEYSREHSNETYLGLSDDDFREDPTRRYAASALDEMDWQRFGVTLRYGLELGKSFDLSVAAYRHDFERTWAKINGFEDPTPLDEILAAPDSARRAVLYDVLTGAENSSAPGETLLYGVNARRFASQGVSAVAQHRSSGGSWYNQLEAGVRVHNDWIERDHTQQEYLMRSMELERDDVPDVKTTQNRGDAVAIAAHVLDEFFIADLTLTPGLRLEIIDTAFTDELAGEETDNLQTILIPGLGAHYALTPELGVLAGVYRGFSPVSPGQPAQIEPETSVNYEVGVRYLREPTDTTLEVIGFFNDYSNLIGECSFSAGCAEALLDQQFNAGQVWVWGAEVSATHQLRLGGDWYLPGRLAYTLTESEFQTSFVSDNPQFGEVDEGDELPYVPTHQGSAQLGVTNGGFELNARVTYIGAMREEAGQGDEGRRTDGYATVDVLGRYEVWEGLSAYGKVGNALNAEAIASRRPYGARPVAPFMARLGLTYDF